MTIEAQKEIFKVYCDTCESKLSFELNDVEYKISQDIHYISCPVCGRPHEIADSFRTIPDLLRELRALSRAFYE